MVDAMMMPGRTPSTRSFLWTRSPSLTVSWRTDVIVATEKCNGGSLSRILACSDSTTLADAGIAPARRARAKSRPTRRPLAATAFVATPRRRTMSSRPRKLPPRPLPRPLTSVATGTGTAATTNLSHATIGFFIRRVNRYEPGLVELIKTFMPDGKTEPLFVLNSGLRLAGRFQYSEAIPVLQAALPLLRRRLGTYHAHCLEGIRALNKAKTAAAATVKRDMEDMGEFAIDTTPQDGSDTPEMQFRKWVPT